MVGLGRVSVVMWHWDFTISHLETVECDCDMVVSYFVLCVQFQGRFSGYLSKSKGLELTVEASVRRKGVSQSEVPSSPTFDSNFCFVQSFGNILKCHHVLPA